MSCFENFFLMSLCPSKDVFDRYDEILDKRMTYKWNLGAEGFLNEIEKINSEGKVYVPKNFSFLNWMKYLDEQISFYCRTELLKVIANLKQFDLVTDQDFLTKLRTDYDPQLDFENYFRRRRYDAGNKKPFDLLLNETIAKIAPSFNNESNSNLSDDFKSDFMKILKGNTEAGYLANIFNASVLLPEYHKIEKYIVFFNLFKVLLKDKPAEQFSFLSKDEFEDQPSSYENNYRKYQESKVRSFLGLR